MASSTTGTQIMTELARAAAAEAAALENANLVGSADDFLAAIEHKNFEDAIEHFIDLFNISEKGDEEEDDVLALLHVLIQRCKS